MKTLVTGANGFLGLYVVERLRADGRDVRALVRRDSPALARLGVEVFYGDLRDENAVAAACEGCDEVQHVGAVAGVWGPWKQYFEPNVLGTRAVLAGCLKYGVKRLVYTSSPSVTFGGEHQSGIDESAPYPTRWLAHYPHTKAIAEREVLAANGSTHARGKLFTCALRPHLIWGPRDNHLIPKLIARAKIGRVRQVGDGTNKIDMVFVENAAHAQVLAGERLFEGSPVCGRAYFISQGEPVSCWGWIGELLAMAGAPPVKKRVSLSAAYAGGAACEAVWSLLRLSGDPPMTRFLALQLGKDHWFDVSRARADFGYAPIVSSAEGMDRLRDWLNRSELAPAR